VIGDDNVISLHRSR